MAILAFVFIAVVAWMVEGRGWPSFWLCMFVGLTVVLVLLVKWATLLYISEMRTRAEREHQRWLRSVDSHDTVVQHEAPVRVQEAVNEGTRITGSYGYKTVKKQAKAQRAERTADNIQRDRDREAEQRRLDLDREAANRNADLDRELRTSLAILEGDQRLTMELAQQVTETLMLMHDLETEGIDRELTRIIDSVDGMRPAMESIFNASGNPQAQKTLLDLYLGTLTRGINEMIGSYAANFFRQRQSRRRSSHDAVPR